MKNRTSSIWTFGLLVTGLPFMGGCAQEPAAPAQTTNSANRPVAVVAAQAETNPTAVTLVDPETVRPVVPDKDAATDRPLPANVLFSPALNDIVKMAQAGVEDSVMLAFVANSSGTFNLGSDQIIYLNDLGMSGSVITAMIQHDNELSAASGQFATASTVPTPAPGSVTEQTAETALERSAAETEPGPQDQQVTSYPALEQEQEAQPTVVNYNYFYDSLAPYGTWVNVGGYGWCWQPTVTVIHAGWRPYCDGGRWLYSDSGWYWQSDYTWGAVAFHYGRWFCHPRWGWCWWPNTVWAPSWVTWRYSDGYCGWAPLPPYSYYRSGFGLTYYSRGASVSFGFGLSAGCYTFVPWHRFSDYRPHRYRVPRERLPHVYDRSVVVNDFVQDSHHGIVNRGIAIDRVANLARGEIRRVIVRDPLKGSAGSVRGDHPRREGGRLVVYRQSPPVSPTHESSPAREARIRPNTSSPGISHLPATRLDFSGRSGRTPFSSGPENIRARPDAVAPFEGGRGNGQRQGFATHGSTDGIGSVRTDARTPAPAPTTAVAPVREAKIETATQPNAPASAAGHLRQPSLDRTTDATALQDKAPPGSIILVGRRDGTRPNKETPASHNATRAVDKGPQNSLGAPASAAKPTTPWQNRGLNPTAIRPSSSGSRPAPQPAPPAVAPTFGRSSAPARIGSSQARVIRQEPASTPRPVMRESSPGPRFGAPPSRATVQPQSRGEAMAAPPARAASSPPPRASSAPERSSGNSDRGGRHGRSASDR